MVLVSKKINGRRYYYSFLSYFLIDRSRSFSKYIGNREPSKEALRRIEKNFREELILRLSGHRYSSLLVSSDDVIKMLLFNEAFTKKYSKLSALQRRKYDIDSTVSFTFTTLTTEDVDVSISDVRNAMNGLPKPTGKERISRNMLKAVESIKERKKLDKKYLLALHRTIMANFETKTPGKIRARQVYLHIRDESGGSKEIRYRPPSHDVMEKMLNEFLAWYNSSTLNPLEKAAIAHYRLYMIHPFLDGNKRMCRLVFNKTLIDCGFPIINVSVDRDKYFDALAFSVQNGRPAVFVGFCISQYYKQVKKFLK